jgi:hypothetical protein
MTNVNNVNNVNNDNLTLSPNDKKCAPSRKYTDNSCMDLDLLVVIAKAYNKSDPTNPIKLSDTHNVLTPNKYKKYIVSELTNKLKDVCSNQRCWLKQEFMKNVDHKVKKILDNDVFRPEGPTGKFTWLNTININQVMKQYESAHPDFLFLGAVPIDFDELPYLGIKDLDFKKLENEGKTKIGIVFNLDEHYKNGSHWVAGYSNLNNGEVYFFDSYGIRPEKRIVNFMNKCAKYIKSKNIKPIVDYNKYRHQYKNSECGVYSMNFIHRLLQGDSFKTIVKDKTPDDTINQYRHHYFIIKNK